MPERDLRQVNSPGGIVATVHEQASQAGIRLLKEGGNAVDAAAAAGLALCVVAPQACGLGGYGGSMVIHLAGPGKTLAIDFDGMAPGLAHENMYSWEPTDGWAGTNPGEYHCNVKDDANVTGPLSIAVPGTIAGMAAAHKAAGRKSWREVVAPAIELAENGFLVSDRLAAQIKAVLENHPYARDLIGLWTPGGKAPQEGETFRIPPMARALKAIAEEGAEVFYSGRIGRDIGRHVQSQGGILSGDDMAAYEARVQEPVSINYRGYQVLCAGLPNGGLSSLQLLKVLERFDLSQFSPLDPEFIRLFAEASKLIWRDRINYFGDPDFIEVDQQRFISEEYTAKQAEQLHGILSPQPERREPDGCTTHFSVVDREHNLVSCTMTNGNAFGSLVAVPEWGVILSHGMCRFDPRPGLANSVAPRKRMLCNMGPYIILKDGKPLAAIGTPGGRPIISVNVHFAVGLLDFKRSIGEILQGPRCHITHETALALNETYPEEVFEAMRRMGYRVTDGGVPAIFAQGIVVNPGGTHSGSNGWACQSIPITE